MRSRILQQKDAVRKTADGVVGRAEPREMVGRAELKLMEAVKAFGYDFRGKTVLDIGSSTGGFTELVLRLGASRVMAVEKGTNQMKAPLRFDKRIVLLEKTDIFEVVIGKPREGVLGRWLAVAGRGGAAELEDGFDVILADVSFVSLRKVLSYVRKNLVSRQTDFLVMLKPQFEATSAQLVRGVVKNEKMRREIMRGFEDWGRANGFLILKKRDNETVGKVGGNRERFYWLRLAR